MVAVAIANRKRLMSRSFLGFCCVLRLKEARPYGLVDVWWSFSDKLATFISL